MQYSITRNINKCIAISKVIVLVSWIRDQWGSNNFQQRQTKNCEAKKNVLKLTRSLRGSSFEISPDCLLILKMLNELTEK